MAEPGASRVEARPRPPVHLWIVGVLALLWNAMGVWDYLATQTRYEPYMSQYSEVQLAYFYGFPAWVVAVWAISVFSGFLGAIALLLRRKWAVWLFALSLAGLVINSIYTFVLSEGADVMGTVGAVMTLVIFVVAIALWWYAKRMAAKGVLT